VGLPERLKYARDRSGLTLAQVREVVGIYESSLSDFENGKREPKLSQLQALATAYNRSIAFLLSDEPIPREVVLWRERPAEYAREIESQFLRLCEQYHNLEIWCDEILPPCLPEAKGSAERFGYQQAAELAKRLRGELGLGDRPAFELLSVLEDWCGVKIFHRDFSPTGTAASTYSELFGAAVLLNSGNVRWRRNHDLAHELFHLLTWPIFRSAQEESSLVAGESEEKLATCFAANLLMPAEVVSAAVERRRDGDKLEFEALYDIAREFDVSVESLLWRLHFLWNRGLAGEEQTRADIEKAKEWSPIFEERERDDSAAAKWPERYRSLAVKALRHGEISVGRFAEYLEISRQKAMSYLEQEAGTSEETWVTSA